MDCARRQASRLERHGAVGWPRALPRPAGPLAMLYRQTEAPAALPLTGRDPRMTRLEAVLFLAREPLSTRKLAQLAALEDGTEARTLVGRLNQHYDASRSAFRVEQLAGGFQLLTRPRYSPWLRRRHQMQVEVRLSSPAIETLAIIAYRQPVLRAEIEAIRGVKCGEIVRQLMERDLVRIAGKSDELGRPFLYGTTRRFLQVFGLRDIDELPRGELRRPNEGPAEEPANAEEATAESEPLDVSPLEEELAVKVSAKTRSASEGRAPRDVEGFEWEEVADVAPADIRNADDDEDEEEEDDEELDDEEDEEDDEELDDEEDEEDDEELEDEEWEEVEDEDEEWDEEEEDDEEEDEDWDEDEDDDDEEWDDDEEDDDEDEEEEEDEGGE
jgi:segregation and condensation protein B